MCNFLRKFDPTFRKILETGTGWKIFTFKNVEKPGNLFGKPKLGQFNRSTQAVVPYIIDNDGWVNWYNRDDKEAKKFITSMKWKVGDWLGDGFCFFLSHEDAINAIKHWSQMPIDHEFVLVSIEYRDGLGERKEEAINFGVDCMVALAGGFRLLSSEYSI